MNPYLLAAFILIGAPIASMGAAMSAGIHDWFAIGGGMATAFAGAMAGLLTRLPQKEWTDAERAEKTGGDK